MSELREEILKHMATITVEGSRAADRVLWAKAGVPDESMSFGAADPLPTFSVGQLVEPAGPPTPYDISNGRTHEVQKRDGDRALLYRYDYGPTDPFWIDIVHANRFRMWNRVGGKA